MFAGHSSIDKRILPDPLVLASISRFVTILHSSFNHLAKISACLVAKPPSEKLAAFDRLDLQTFRTFNWPLINN
jgi:hypothetical protein